ncbi:tetratricopeptide repeat protein [Aureivirga sp. CE67]|uniref:tetratricopeptide repeat protein n=1 Tax=Aureivirga sp. CE67 TaxID=1788983 RepID=UPI0018CB01E3|nr:tetratricopeptide repeat protein [Aureivirga sp. CE67]
MKKKVIVLSAALLVGTVAFSQKKEIKLAEKSLKAESYDRAIENLKEAKALIDQTGENKYLGKYYLNMGKAYLGKGEDVQASEFFNKLLKYEKETKSKKYTSEAKKNVSALVGKFDKEARLKWNAAKDSKSPKDYTEAAMNFYQVYKLQPTDTAYLDNAALSLFFAKDYKGAIDKYQELLDTGYTGIKTTYKSKDISTGKEIPHASKKAMDTQVKLGLVKDPQVVVEPSRRSGIVKTMSNAYIALEQYEKALELIKKQREEEPKNYDLLLTEASVHYALGDKEMFKNLQQKAIELAPDNATLYYNVGVVTLDQGDVEGAISYFEKATEIDPNYAEAYNNIGVAILEEEKAIVKEMNENLNNFDKYDALQAKQMDLYKKALPSFEKAFQLKPNESVGNLLYGIYGQLEMYDKQKEVKAKVDAMVGQ